MSAPRLPQRFVRNRTILNRFTDNHRLMNTSKPATSPKPVSNFDGIESKLTTRYYVETILADKKYHILDEFASIYGIGPSTAQALYAKGARTVEDLVKYYKVPADLKDTTQQSRAEPVTSENWIEVSLALKDDLNIKCDYLASLHQPTQCRLGSQEKR
jgi:hypothetical protein